MGIGLGKLDLIKRIIKENFNFTENDMEKTNYSFNEILYIIQEIEDNEGYRYTVPDASRGKRLYKSFTDYIFQRNLRDFDSTLLITGEKGSGKSSAAIVLAREWCRILGIKFDPKRHVAYTNADVVNKVDNLRKFEPLIADESVRFASSEDWNKKENKKLKKKLAQIRRKYHLFILCFPLKINKVEKNYLQSFTNYWIDLFERGNGAVYIKDKNPARDSWRIDDFKKLGSYTEFTSIEKIKEKLKKHPNFWSMINFPKLPRRIYEKYLNIREQNVYDDDTVKDSVTRDDIYRALLILALRDIMTNDAALTMNRIRLHIKNNYDIPIPKKAIDNSIRDSKQLIDKMKEEFVDERGQDKTENMEH